MQALGKNNFSGFIEAVPAYNSLAIFYDVVTIKIIYAPAITAFEWVRSFMEQLISEMKTTTGNSGPVINIPVYYNGADLIAVATQRHLSVTELIRIHTAIPYRVFMIGFLPGFAYMGKVDERIAVPRHAVPRINVQPGSVGIAGFQTGIYPLQSPGGWQLVGQTPIKIFDINKNDPCLLKAGDRVQFISISKETFDQLNEY